VALRQNQRLPSFSSHLLIGFLLLALLSLSGCGFHLRGLDSVGQSQFKTVQLQNVAGVRSEMLLAIRKQMALSGVEVVDSELKAEVIILLKPTFYKVSRTAYSGQGDVTGELLKMGQSFSAIWTLSGEELTKGQLETFRDRQIETSAMLASDEELTEIRQSMAEALVRQLMDRINRAVIKQAELQSQQGASLKTSDNASQNTDRAQSLNAPAQ